MRRIRQDGHAHARRTEGVADRDVRRKDDVFPADPDRDRGHRGVAERTPNRGRHRQVRETGERTGRTSADRSHAKFYLAKLGHILLLLAVSLLELGGYDNFFDTL